jgi:hypothetical protein
VCDGENSFLQTSDAKNRVSTDFNWSPISNFTKIDQLGAQLMHADGQMDMTKVIDALSRACKRD